MPVNIDYVTEHSKYIEAVNKDTGEVWVHTVVSEIDEQHKSKIYTRDRFGVHFWQACEQIGDAGFSRTAYRILFCLLAHLGKDRTVIVSVPVLAKRFGLTRRLINRCLKELIDANLLLVVSQLGAKHVYKWNERAFFYGPLSEYPKDLTGTPMLLPEKKV